MERRNVDFEVSLTREQWDRLGRTAAALSDYSVLEWSHEQPETIEVRARTDDAPSGFQDVESSPDGYDSGQQPVAEFVFNDGHPYAALPPPSAVDPPAVPPQREQALERELQRWVRNKWHELVDEAGVEIGS